MFTASIFTTWLLAASIVTAFEFTSPAKGATLNLSSPVDITWTSQNEQFSEVDLAFVSPVDYFSFNIATNLSVSAGSFTWQPMKTLQGQNFSLSKGKDFQFHAELHNANSSVGSGVESDDFAVTGGPLMSAAAVLQPHIGAALFTVVFLVMAFLL